MYLNVVEGYAEFRGKLVKVFAKCLGIEFDHIIFVIVKDEEEDNA